LEDRQVDSDWPWRGATRNPRTAELEASSSERERQKEDARSIAASEGKIAFFRGAKTELSVS
jgi:hypothetical protein